MVIWWFVALCSNLTRTNTVTANALLNEIRSYGLGEPNHCSLGGTIDTPVNNACVEETHLSLTHSHTQAKQLSEIRGLQRLAKLQRHHVPLSRNSSTSNCNKKKKIWGRSFTFYAWCNRCHVNNVSRLLCQHLEWQMALFLLNPD